MDALAEYQSLLTKLHDIERDANSMATAISDIGHTARAWKSLMISNDNNVRFPIEIGLNPQSPSIDRNKWPSIDAFRDLIQSYHDTRLALRNAWNRIPVDRRIGLSAPN